MPDTSPTSRAFWDTMSEHVTGKVALALRQGRRARAPAIAYLPDLEAVARRACGDRGVIQVIASGRHVLGDRAEIGPADGPFSRT